MKLTYPRFVHSEFMTHRMFSRNAASSRAIPFAKMREAVLKDIAYPVEWGSNKPGMQAGEQIKAVFLAKALWTVSAYIVSIFATYLHLLGLHKQIVNRLLEPFCHITVLVTGSDAAWSNFFWLRDHKDADPTIAKMAKAAKEAYVNSQPKELSIGQWHLPYADNSPSRLMKQQHIISVARCARVSYALPGIAPVSTLEADTKLYDRLLGANPKHASPAEHQACAIPGTASAEQGGNLGQGWMQLRKTLSGEANLTMFRSESETA
jgi:hypothetical protein